VAILLLRSLQVIALVSVLGMSGANSASFKLVESRENTATLPSTTAQTAAETQTAYYWVENSGNDSNDCVTVLPNVPSQSPCLTIQAAINKIPSYRRAVINVGPGIYHERLNIVGYMRPFVSISGPHDADGTTCINPRQVVINAGGGQALWIQDHATVVLECLAIDQAAVGVSGRQHIIADLANIVFGDVGVPIAMTEFSIASCGNRPLSLTASGSVFAFVEQSRLNIGCQINIADGVNFSHFFEARSYSRINTTGARFNGNIAGRKWLLKNSEIGPDCNVPGADSTQDALSTAPPGC
jgi:hypothetical protein